MRFGVCYYPEQWPEDRWPVDVREMADLGLDLVRIGEFAWSTIEPERGRFDWRVLDRTVELVAQAGMKLVMGTPTATPPVWLVLERPDVLGVNPDGRRRAYGSRRHTCTTSSAYREESARIVGAMVDRFGSHPDVVAWQVDNEPGNHDSARCWCDECQAAFTEWLEHRFGSIDELNRQWGTSFWSQTYPSFESVRLPVPTMTTHHPALRLAHAKFASDQSVAFCGAQFEIIRAGTPPNTEITTNLYCEDLAVDARALARLGGVASMDNYPHGVATPLDTAYLLDLHAGAAGSEGRAWVMEQQVGPVNWTSENPQVPDGQVRVWLWQAALHGYDAILLFRWRAARFGQEQYHSGLLRHDGQSRRVSVEIRSTMEEIRTAGDVAPRPTVALLHSYKDAWAMGINPHREGLTHRKVLHEAYVAARRLGLDVAIVDSTHDLTGFDLVLAPGLQITTPERVAALDQALDAGVTVVLGARSLVMDRESAWTDLALPGGLSDRLGTRVVATLSQTGPVVVSPWGTPAGWWTDVLEDGSDVMVLARYGGGTYLDDRPAVVRNGNLVYAGFSDRRSWQALLEHVTSRMAHPDNLEVFERGDTVWVIDHAALTVGRR
ncbi:MAG: beta-galactosidase [Acidimicrobiia bacterium]|nr:beta-galactosidase [Acidimicrobiia bacterium]